MTILTTEDISRIVDPKKVRFSQGDTAFVRHCASPDGVLKAKVCEIRLEFKERRDGSYKVYVKYILKSGNRTISRYQPNVYYTRMDAEKSYK